jgi:hypothetical protein
VGKRRVVVEGGGANLYEILEYGGSFIAYHVSVRLLSNDRTRIGSGRSLQDAIAIIQAHSGRRIRSID